MHIKNYTRMTCPCVCAYPGWLAVCQWESECSCARSYSYSPYLWLRQFNCPLKSEHGIDCLFRPKSLNSHYFFFCMNIINCNRDRSRNSQGTQFYWTQPYHLQLVIIFRLWVEPMWKSKESWAFFFFVSINCSFFSLNIEYECNYWAEMIGNASN